MKRRIVWTFALLVVPLLLVTGCGGGSQLTYRVTGSAPEVDVAYRDAEGNLQQVTANPPWEVSLDVGDEFSFELSAVRTGGSGDVACEVLLGEESLGTAQGRVSASCEGSFRREGGSLSTSFTSGSDTVLDERMKEAADLIDAERYDEAVAALQDLLQIDPENYRIYGLLGIAYYDAERYDEAADAFNQVVQLAPDDPGAYYYLGLIHTQKGNVAEAHYAFQTYLELRPDAPDREQVEGWIAELEAALLGLEAEYAAPAGYSVRYPTDWVYIVMGEDQVAFLRSEEDKERIVAEAPVVFLQAGPLDELGENLGLGEITSVEQALQGGLAHFGAQAGEMETFQVAGYPAGMVEMSGTMEGMPFRGGLAFVLVEDWGFAFTGVAPPDQWDDVAPLFEGMVRTFSLPRP